MNWRSIIAAATLLLGVAACGKEEGRTEAAPLRCPEGQLACAGGCAEPASDPRHCGGCDLACDEGEVCAEGRCATTCPPGLEACGGACVSLADANENCGACGNVCAHGTTCSGGACTASCPAGQIVCDGACVSTGSARDHCGACGNACEAGETCVDGACALACPEGLVACDGACVAAGRDRANCGSCGAACDAGELCIDGSCELACAPGFATCDGACRDTGADRNHCGACGNACAEGSLCVDGACTPACAGFHDDRCGDGCTNTDVDPANCGACGNACPDGQVCSEGACTGVCTPGLVACDGGCTSLADDPAHCGACGTGCDAAPNAAAVCIGGSCARVCAAGQADCNLDLETTATDGCETTLATDVEHCGACGAACPVPDRGVAACVAGSCGIGACEPGFADCDLDPANGCEVDLSSDRDNCGTCGTVCGTLFECAAGSCGAPQPGENCFNPITLVAGRNTVPLEALRNDYFTAQPACVPGSITQFNGPDVVMDYVAPFTGQVGIYFDKQANNRWVASVTDACGDLSAPLACISDLGPNHMGGTFPVTAGMPYSIHLIDIGLGAALTDPIEVHLAEFACGGYTASTALSPQNGGTAAGLFPILEAEFGAAITAASGATVTLTGRGTSLTFAVPSTSVAINGRRLLIDPRLQFPAGERVSVTWSGLRDAGCSNPIPPPPWTFTVPSPACAPGSGGVIGNGITRLSIGAAGSTQPLYVAPDADPAGWVYFGSATQLYRARKGGGVHENVLVAAGLGPAQLGSAMLVDGPDLYTLERKSSGTSGHLWRISSDGGASWRLDDAATFPSPDANSFSAMAKWNGRIYLVTARSTFSDSVGGGGGVSTPTHIWSIDPSSPLPAVGVLEQAFGMGTYGECNGLAVDAQSFFTSCRRMDNSGFALLRVDRATGAVAELLHGYSATGQGGAVVADDTDGNGIADVLYLSGNFYEAWHLCAPGGTPSIGYQYRLPLPAGQGPALPASTMVGLGLDAANDVLWSLDGATLELLRIQ